MEKVTVSAPGKLVLLGEHAVVYGRPCIVTAVDQRMSVKMKRIEEKIFTLDAPSVDVVGYKKDISALGTGDVPKGARFVEAALNSFFKKYGIETGVAIETDTGLSASYGFGSSSAATVCAIQGLAKLMDIELSKREVFDLAFQTHFFLQGSGSGVDVAAAVFGGTLVFVREGKRIDPILIDHVPFVIGFTGITTSTTQILAEVLELAGKYPSFIDGLYTSMGEITEAAIPAFTSGDWQTVGDLMNINQGYLEALGVGCKELSALMYAAREAGAFGAKLSGGGRGECMMAAVNDQQTREAVIEAIINAGGEHLDVQMHADGVRIES